MRKLTRAIQAVKAHLICMPILAFLDSAKNLLPHTKLQPCALAVVLSQPHAQVAECAPAHAGTELNGADLVWTPREGRR